MLPEGKVGSGIQTHCERLVLSQRDTLLNLVIVCMTLFHKA